MGRGRFFFKMKLLLVISSMHAGGAERVLSILANSWAGMGREVVLVTTHDDGQPSFYPLDPDVRPLPILLSDIPGGGHLSNLKRTRALRQIICGEAPDLVVSFLNYTNVLTLLACQGLAVPVIISERLDPRVHRLSRLWDSLRRLTYPRAVVLVNQTEAAASWFRPWMGDRVRIIANPVLKPDLGEGDPEIVIEGPTVVAMGRLHPQKGFSTLLRAMRIVHEQRPDLRLVVLGDGDQRSELEGLRHQMGLDEVVDFPGRVRNPYKVLEQALMFVMSSVTEGFPNVLCEAMAVGLPVISTDCPSGPGEIITEGRDGLLVPVGDPGTLARAILSLMADPETCRALGAAAQNVVSRFSLEATLKLWEEVLTEAGHRPISR